MAVIVCGILGGLVILVIWLVGRIVIPEFFNQRNIVEVKSAVDNRDWKVQGDFPCPECAANALAKLNSETVRFIKHLQNTFPNDPRVRRIVNRYNPNKIYEGRPSPGGLGDTSYTLNKGQRLVYCARSGRDVSKIIDENTMKYVHLGHELAHLASASVGHNKEFDDNFLWILTEAAQAGFYTPIDYRRNPKEFCGIMINSSILY